jgi:hypothetical protein
MDSIKQRALSQEAWLYWDENHSKWDIFLALKDKFHTGGAKSFPKYKDKDLIEAQKEVVNMRKSLKEKGVISDPRAANPETRKREIVGTVIAGYLQLLMSNPDDYIVWNVEREWDQKIVWVEEYNWEKTAVLDAIRFDLSKLSDKEIKVLFSTLTDHDFNSPVGVSNAMRPTQKQWNIVHYRNHALHYTAALKAVLKSAKSISIPGNQMSDKILQITEWPWKWKFVEFKYRNFMNSDRKYDLEVYVVIHNSLQECKNSLSEGIVEMNKEVRGLKIVEQNCLDFQDSIKGNPYDKWMWKEKINDIYKELENISKSQFVQKSGERVERSEQKHKDMHDNQYRNMLRGIINDIWNAINQRIAMIERYKEYMKAEENVQNEGYATLA